MFLVLLLIPFTVVQAFLDSNDTHNGSRYHNDHSTSSYQSGTSDHYSDVSSHSHQFVDESEGNDMMSKWSFYVKEKCKKTFKPTFGNSLYSCMSSHYEKRRNKTELIIIRNETYHCCELHSICNNNYNKKTSDKKILYPECKQAYCSCIHNLQKSQVLLENSMSQCSFNICRNEQFFDNQDVHFVKWHDNILHLGSGGMALFGVLIVSLLIVTTVLIAVLSRRYCKKKPTKPPTDAQPEATNAEDTDVTATATSRPPIGPIVTGSTSSEITSGNVQDSTTPATTAPSGPAQANAAPNVPYPMPGIDPPLLAPLNDSTSAEPVHQAV